MRQTIEGIMMSDVGPIGPSGEARMTFEREPDKTYVTVRIDILPWTELTFDLVDLVEAVGRLTAP